MLARLTGKPVIARQTVESMCRWVADQIMIERIEAIPAPDPDRYRRARWDACPASPPVPAESSHVRRPPAVPLNHLVAGAYLEVVTRTGWNRRKAIRQCRRAWRRLGFDPRTDQDHQRLLDQARQGRLLDHQLY